MKKIIKTLGVVAVLGTVAMASNGTSSTLTVEALNGTIEDTTTVYGGHGGNHCDFIERLMGFCRSSQPLLEN